MLVTTPAGKQWEVRLRYWRRPKPWRIYARRLLSLEPDATRDWFDADVRTRTSAHSLALPVALLLFVLDHVAVALGPLMDRCRPSSGDLSR